MGPDHKFFGQKNRAEFLIGRGGTVKELKVWRNDVKQAEKGLLQLSEQVPGIMGMVGAFEKEMEPLRRERDGN